MSIIGKKFFIFAGQKTVRKGFDENPTLYRDFVADRQLNGPENPSTRIGPNIQFIRNSGATFYNSSGIIQIASPNTPRFEYGPDTVYSGLFIEEQRANLVNYSQDFTQNETWFVAASTDGPGLSLTNAPGITALDGTFTVTKITDTAARGFHTISWTPGTDTDNGYYDRSIFIKQDTARFIILGCAGTPFASNVFTTYDLELSSFPGNTPFDTVYAEPIRDGWIRIGFLRDSTIDNTNTNRILIGIAHGENGEQVFHTSPVSEPKSLYIWGAQVERGFQPTSYIPTNGQQVIRAEDLATIDSVRFIYMFNKEGGSFFIKSSRNNLIRPNTFASFTNQAITDYWSFESRIDEPDKNRVLLVQNNIDEIFNVTQVSTILNSTTTTTPKTFYTLAASVSAGNFIYYQDQALVGENVESLQVPFTISEFELGRRGNQFLNGHIQKIGYWPRRLPNEELELLN